MSVCALPSQPPELGALEFAEFLHGEAQGGWVGLASLDHRGRWHEHPVRISDMSGAICAVHGETDTFLSYNRFKWRRRTVNDLLALDALFTDIDHYKRPANDPVADMSPKEVAEAVIGHLDGHDISAPSLMTFTGRGLSACWVIDPIPAAAHPRWRACQIHLVRMLRPFGSDAQAIDATRLIRLPGTVNNKSGLSVRVLEQQSSFDRFDFEDMAKQVLPHTREELAAMRAKRRQKPSAKQPGTPCNHAYSVRTLHQTRICDIRKLIDGRWPSGIPEGQRNALMFHTACSMAWLTTPDGLRQEMMQCAAEFAGWSEAEATRCVAAVLSRMEEARSGNDRRYRYCTDTIIDELAVTEAEMRDLDLRCLVSDKVRRERDAARKQTERRRAGVIEREEYEGQARQRWQKALDLHARGLSHPQIGSALAISGGAARKLVSRAREAGLTPSAEKPLVVVSNKPGTVPALTPDKSVQVYDGKPCPGQFQPDPQGDVLPRAATGSRLTKYAAETKICPSGTSRLAATSGPRTANDRT